METYTLILMDINRELVEVVDTDVEAREATAWVSTRCEEELEKGHLRMIRSNPTD